MREWLSRPAVGKLAGAIGILAVSGAAGGLVGARYAVQGGPGGVAVAAPETRPAATPTSPLLKQTSESFRAVARQVGPAVVVIKAVTEAPRGAAPQAPSPYGAPPEAPFGGPGMPGDPFWELFRGFGFEQPQPPSGKQSGLGSGFVVDKRGYIVTNNHVVANATKVSVVLSDDESTEIPATVVGRDPKTDLAVLKIEPKRELTVAEWGDSNALEVGDWAVAIGSPFMLSHSVTAGIVSAKGRNANELMGADFGFDMIQTDAAINPGNSGGPLCSLDGKVIGVNTAIYTHSGGYMGIGFAIPSALAKEITRTLIEHGQITRGWLGIAIRKAEPELLKELDVDRGIVVQSVQPDSPASQSGLRPGDVILSVDQTPIKTPADLQRAVATRKPGDKVSVQVIPRHDRKSTQRQIRLGQAPEGRPRA